MSGPPANDFLARCEEHLHPAAVRAADSGGRAHGEDEHPYRSCYQRDRDRIIHCSAFRRLDYKTQVFVPHEQDHYRTRLTHTLEVAQVARTLARALALNEDVAEAAALGHDLGHPPFGHAGEAALDELMAAHGRFEHNRQSLRVVDYLEHPYVAFRGLNLTGVVRLCLARHESPYDRGGGDQFPQTPSAPLEGQLVDLADEIAYTSADTYDALAAGWIDAGQLGEMELWRRAAARADAARPGVRPVQKRIQACREVLALLADDVLAETAGRVERMGLATPADVQRSDSRAAAFSDEITPCLRQLQDFLAQRVYCHPVAAGHAAEARRLIGELFSAYLAEPALLPKRYRGRTAHDGLHRLICDYIAGMTDRFCRAEHEKVVGRRS